MNRNILTGLSVLGACLAVFYAVSVFRDNYETTHLDAPVQNQLPSSHWQPNPNGSGLLLASHVAQGNRDWKNANLFLTEAFQFGTPDMPTQMRAMALALGSGDINDALKMAQTVVKERPTPETQESLELANILLATDLVKQGKTAEALAITNSLKNGPIGEFVRPLFTIWLSDKAVTVTQQTPTILLHQAMMAETKQDQVASLRALRKLVDYPRSPIASSIAAAIALRANETGLAQDLLPNLPKQDAVALLQTLTNELDRLTPGGAQLLDWHLKGTSEGLSLALLDLSGLLLQQRAYDSAMLFARMGSMLSPNLTALLHLQANVLKQENRIDDALAIYRSIPENTPGYLAVQLQIAEILSETDKTEDAISVLKKLDTKNNSEILYTLGDLYRRQNNMKMAIDSYTSAIKLDEEKAKDPQSYWYAYYFRGMTYAELDKWDQAEADLQKAISLNDQDAHLLNYLGYSWAEKGKNLVEAAALLDRALRLAPADPYIIDSVGWVAFQQGDLEKAQRYLELAVTIKPYDPTINDHIGDLYAKLGRTRDAHYQYLRALSYASDTKTMTPDEKLISSLKAKLEQL